MVFCKLSPSTILDMPTSEILAFQPMSRSTLELEMSMWMIYVTAQSMIRMYNVVQLDYLNLTFPPFQ